jgi:hypothetical protein
MYQEKSNLSFRTELISRIERGVSLRDEEFAEREAELHRFYCKL